MPKALTAIVLALTLPLAACDDPYAAAPEPTDEVAAPAQGDPPPAEQEEEAPAETPEDPAVTDPGTPGVDDTGDVVLDDTGAPAPAEPVSWALDVEPILGAACAGCHLGGGASGGFSFDGGAADLVGVSSAAGMPYVSPGAPEQSYLWHKLDGTQISGSRMPLGGALSDPELELIELWILDGALP